MAREAFLFLNSFFYLNFQADEEINRENILEASEKYEILHGDRFEYLPPR
jgi:hypothetical protein